MTMGCAGRVGRVIVRADMCHMRISSKGKRAMVHTLQMYLGWLANQNEHARTPPWRRTAAEPMCCMHAYLMHLLAFSLTLDAMRLVVAAGIFQSSEMAKSEKRSCADYMLWLHTGPCSMQRRTASAGTVASPQAAWCLFARVVMLVLVTTGIGQAVGQDKILDCQLCSFDDECASGQCVDPVDALGVTICAASDPARPCSLVVRFSPRSLIAGPSSVVTLPLSDPTCHVTRRLRHSAQHCSLSTSDATGTADIDTTLLPPIAIPWTLHTFS